MTKPEMLILSGLPGSGKTHVANEWVAEDPDARVRVNYDDLRRADGRPFSWEVEREIKARANAIAAKAINAGLSVVVDNTNLTPRSRDTWASLAKNLGATVVYEEVDTPIRECVRRDATREGVARVGRAVIERMALFNGFIDWEDPIYHEKFVIVDVDGTIADCSHRLHFVTRKCEDCGAGSPITTAGPARCFQCHSTNVSKKDWPSFFKACDLDKPIQPIIDLVEMLSRRYDILVVSGRAIDFSGKLTEDWLDRHNISYDHLFMRNGGDGRVDTEVKQEILDLLPKERIKYVLDDRSSVVDMWRKNGLTCLQVAAGDF